MNLLACVSLAEKLQQRELSLQLLIERAAAKPKSRSALQSGPPPDLRRETVSEFIDDLDDGHGDGDGDDGDDDTRENSWHGCSTPRRW